MTGTPQAAIFDESHRYHHYLELDVRGGAVAAEPGALRDALRRLAAVRAGTADARLVIALGPALLRRLAGERAPALLADFAPINGANGHLAPATQHDVWVWAQGGEPGVLLDAAMAAAGALEPVAELRVDQPAYYYRDHRDITGFIDGTENPKPPEAPSVAVVPPGEAGEGGSFVLAMTFGHDLAAFSAAPLAEQEGTIGRTKAASVELDDATKPPTAHIARVVITDDGEELEIYRRGAAYGGVERHGQYFVAFTKEPTRIDRMLARMYGTSGDGLTDHLLDFTVAATGARYFAPSEELLAELTVTRPGA